MNVSLGELRELVMNREAWWWTGRPGVLRFMGSQRVGHDWATELNWTESHYLLVMLICQFKGKRRINTSEVEGTAGPLSVMKPVRNWSWEGGWTHLSGWSSLMAELEADPPVALLADFLILYITALNDDDNVTHLCPLPGELSLRMWFILQKREASPQRELLQSEL